MKELIKIDFEVLEDGNYRATSQQLLAEKIRPYDYCYEKEDVIEFFSGLEQSIKDYLADGILETILEQLSFGDGYIHQGGISCLYYTMYKSDGDDDEKF